MMIAHASIPADDPARAAAFLAEIMGGGQVNRFPPGGPEAWMAWSSDGKIELEVVRRGATIQYGEEQGDWNGAASGRHSETHLAICVDRPEAEIIAIAKKAGWPARHCERGGGLFSLVEVWVDGAFMIEFLDPAQTAIYQERITPAKWTEYLKHMPQAA